jgi:hypothetical protein
VTCLRTIYPHVEQAYIYYAEPTQEDMFDGDFRSYTLTIGISESLELVLNGMVTI